MNTKGVEDGITDEQAAELKLECFGFLRCMDHFYGEEYVPEDPGAQTAITNIRKLINMPPVIKPIAAIRSATPEELTAQAESYGKNYKPGPRQATPFMPEVSATGLTFIHDGKGNMKIATVRQAVIENIIRDVAELPDRNSPDNWPEAMLVTHNELAAILDERLAPSAPPTLPVPERTALPTREAVEAALGMHDYPAKTIKWHLALLTEGERRILFRAVIDAALPVPERTVEMDELMGRLRESMRYLRAIAPMGVMLNAIKDASRDVETLLDHIEGKPKLSIQEVKE